jgi:hypothetical protein
MRRLAFRARWSVYLRAQGDYEATLHSTRKDGEVPSSLQSMQGRGVPPLHVWECSLLADRALSNSRLTCDALLALGENPTGTPTPSAAKDLLILRVTERLKPRPDVVYLASEQCSVKKPHRKDRAPESYSGVPFA